MTMNIQQQFQNNDSTGTRGSLNEVRTGRYGTYFTVIYKY